MRRSQTLLGLSAHPSKPAPPAKQAPPKPPPPILQPSRESKDAPTDVITAPGGDPITMQGPMPNMPPPPFAPPFVPYLPQQEPPASTSQSLKTVRPPMMTRANPRTIVAAIVGLALAVLVLAGIVTLATRSDSRTMKTADAIPTASAALVPSAMPKTSATTEVAAVTPPTIATPPLISPSATTTSSAPPVRHAAARHHFTIAEGKGALDAASATLGDCKRQHGHVGAGSIRATFSPASGNVIHVQLGPPYAGSAQGRCIIAKFMAAQVRPFHGPPSAINYIFRFPR
ncbi:MAG: hypothetical protein ACRELY_08910 [Polyangiaceae bacterium]